MTPVNIHLDQRLLPVQRATQLTRSLHHLRSKETIRWTWATTMKTPLPYFAPGEAESGKPADAFAFVPHDRVSNWQEIDVLILIAHGSDVSSRIFEYRNRNPNLLVLIWLWDNHVAQVNNLRTVMAGDIYFPSHAYASGYLPNLLAPFGSHVPLCVAQWDPSEAALFLADSSGIPRSNQLLLNYVDYKFSWRTTLLEQIRNHLPEANNLLMPPEDRGRYFKKTKRERYFEWAEHKCTLILPVDQDLSTRVFDALLAGQVIIVPRNIPDFDSVISPESQNLLGVVRIEGFEMHQIRAGIARAIQNFDLAGDAGVKSRGNFVLQGHMLRERMYSILSALLAAAQETISVRFTENQTLHPALRFTANS